MSVLIKGFKIPENCIKCPMQFGGMCYVAPPEIDERVAPTVDEACQQGKPKWCPLALVVTTHDDLISRQAAIDAMSEAYEKDEFWEDYEKRLNELPAAEPDYTEMKHVFLNMASYIYVLLECSDDQKETLIRYISRLSEFMPWTEDD